MRLIIIATVTLLGLSGCGAASGGNSPVPPTATSTATRTATPTVTPTATPEGPAVTPSEQAAKLLGKTATIEVKRGYCSYMPRVTGAPTFCNDRAFPNHFFTLVVWGKERARWNPPPESWDGKCFRITGTVSSFREKPQIEATTASQVVAC